MRLGAWLLAAGFVFGVAGAGVPSLFPVWNAPEHRRLTLIADRQRQWVFSAVAFLTSIVLVAVGLGAVTADLDRAGDGGSAWVGFTAFVLASTMAAPVFAYRISATTRVARDVADGSSTPGWYPAVSEWVFVMLVGYVVLASLGLIAYGSSVVTTGILPEWSGWVLIGLGATFIVSSAVVRDIYPVEPHLGTGLLAVLILIQT